MLEFIVSFFLFAGVVILAEKTLPGIRLESNGTAVLVALVYSLLNNTLGWVLGILSLPFLFLTLGLFTLVINTFLLWITDKLMDSFDIIDLKTTFLAALLLTVGKMAIGAVVPVIL